MIKVGNVAETFSLFPEDTPFFCSQAKLSGFAGAICCFQTSGFGQFSPEFSANQRYVQIFVTHLNAVGILFLVQIFLLLVKT